MLKNFWYIGTTAKKLGKKPVRTVILGENIVIFRTADDRVVALEDRCLHRNAKLSAGEVQGNCLVCPYHGWSYDAEGRVTDIPSEGGASRVKRKQRSFAAKIHQGYVYVFLGEQERAEEIEPFTIPHYTDGKYHNIKLINRFANSVINCVENFVDIPHTVYVHPGIFRVRKNQRFSAHVTRHRGEVTTTYSHETDNLGFFSWFLNPDGAEIVHSDQFYMPNVTCVQYEFGRGKHFIITSQSIPIGDNDTLVYTDLTYNYGIWNKLAAPLVRQQAQTIIGQDQVILKNQGDNLKVYGEAFQNSPADFIHVMIESIQKSLERGRDPLQLPLISKEIEFWV